MFEVDAATGGFGILREIDFDFGKVIFVASAVGVEADDREIQTVERIGAVEAFIHSDFAGEADTGMFARKLRNVEEVNAEGAIAIFPRPEFSFVQSALVLLQDFGCRGFTRVHYDNYLDRGIWARAAPERSERIEEIWFVVARDDNDHSQLRMRWFLDYWWIKTEPINIIRDFRRGHRVAAGFTEAIRTNEEERVICGGEGGGSFAASQTESGVRLYLKVGRCGTPIAEGRWAVQVGSDENSCAQWGGRLHAAGFAGGGGCAGFVRGFGLSNSR